MSNHAYTPADDAFIRANFGKLSFAEMGRQLHRSKHQIRGRWLTLTGKNVEVVPTPPPAADAPEVEWSGDAARDTNRAVTFQIELPLAEAPTVIRDPAELLRRANIDYDKTQWQIGRFKVGSWSTPMRAGEERAHGPKDALGSQTSTVKVTILQVQNYQVRVDFERVRSDDPQVTKQAIIDEIREATSRLRFPTLPKGPSPIKAGGHCLELAFFDLHYGKLAWAEETGENYDHKIADERVEQGVNEVLRNVSGIPISQILLPIGNNLVHVDNMENTTAKGTRQDVDSRVKKILKKCRQMVLRQILKLQQVAPVVVQMVPGNHDSLLTWTIGDSLECFFQDRGLNVTIDNSPRTRKFFRFGRNLIMFTHGDKEKPNDLAAIFATECPSELWAGVTTREVHMGHLHKEHERWFTNTNQVAGFKIRVLRSLSGTDAWHYGEGYIGGERCVESFVWHPERGIVAEFAGYADAK